MRWLIGLLLVSVVLAAGEKKVEKRPTKKAHSSKPTKTPKSIVEEFTALPPADVDFIKELDRQFREHGNKIRIKVERSNGTDGKNIKRTIEGELGYGHYSSQDETGYHFSKPKYMIYPYSQHDIPPVRSTHSTETVTDIEITPSHSYELKPIEEVYQVYPTQQYSQDHQHYYQHEQTQHQAKQLYQQDDTPVIVLKIPGPSKYAAHLQALLQQYLEVRAAQLYKQLEEHELQQQQQQQQHHQQQQQQHELQHQQQLVQQHYVQQEQEPASHHHHHHHHQQQEQHTKTKYSQPDPVYPTEIAYVPMIRTSHNTYVPLPEKYYDAAKAPTARPTKRPNYRKTTVTPTHVTFHSTAQPEPAYHYQTYHPEQQQQHHAQVHDQGHTQIQYQYVAQQPTAQQEEDHEAHYVYSKPVVNFVTPVPGHHGHEDPYQHQHQHQQQQQHHHQPALKYPNFAEYHHHHRPQQQQEEDYLPEPKLVENYPSHKHTRVVYKSPALKAELQQEAAVEQHDHYHHLHHQLEQQQQQQQEVAHHLAHHQEQQQQQQQHQYILQEVYPSQAAYFEDKSFVESAVPQATTDRSETASPHYNTEEIVAITQKPKRLYNYHAHSSGHGHGAGSRGSRMAAGSGSRSRASGSAAKAAGAASKRDTTGAPYTEDEFRKVNKMVQRMKKKSRPAVDEPGMTTVGLSVSSTSPSPRMAA